MSNRSDQYTKGVLGGVRCDADISTGMMTLYNIFSIKHPFYVTAIASFVPYSEMREIRVVSYKKDSIFDT